jgi:hypothetical protein
MSNFRQFDLKNRTNGLAGRWMRHQFAIPVPGVSPSSAYRTTTVPSMKG